MSNAPASPAASPDRPGARPELVYEDLPAEEISIAEKPLSALEMLYDEGFVRKAMILIVLALVWEAYGRYLNNDLLFPTFTQTMSSFLSSVAAFDLPARLGVDQGASDWLRHRHSSRRRVDRARHDLA